MMANTLTWALAFIPMLFIATLVIPDTNATQDVGPWIRSALYGGTPSLAVTWILIACYAATPLCASWGIAQGFRIRRVIAANGAHQSKFCASMCVTALLLVLWCCSLSVGPCMLWMAYVDATTGR